MNYNMACNVLDLLPSFSDKELRNSYYIKALKYHPDKNPSQNANEQFQEIIDAYRYLSQHKNTDPEEYSYFKILERFICDLTDHNIDIKHFLSILNNKYTEISIQLLQKLSKDTLLKFHTFIKQYNDILNINGLIVCTLDELVKKHTENDTVICLPTSLDNLMNDDIYKLEYNEEIYYIPLWHNELIYDLSNTSLIVRCVSDMPEYMSLDCYNNLTINLSMTLESIINQETITINIVLNQYTIPIKQLYIKKYQRFIFKKGISQIDINDIYNVENRANIYVDIHFTDVSTLQ